jgi:hypothetical protein
MHKKTLIHWYEGIIDLISQLTLTELAPCRGFGGCRGFTGPLPPPLLMSICNCSYQYSTNFWGVSMFASLAALAPCTRFMHHYLIYGLCGCCAPRTLRQGGSAPVRLSSRPKPAPLGPLPSMCHYRIRRALQALAPCTRSRWALPPAPPLGPFHFPRPLEIQVFFGAEFPPIMPLPRYSGAKIALIDA